MYGGLDPEYVLDRMSVYEMECYFESLYLRQKDNWEQTRQVVYTIAQCNSRHKINIHDVMPLSWDKPTETMDDQERDRLSGLMNDYITKKNGG